MHMTSQSMNFVEPLALARGYQVSPVMAMVVSQQALFSTTTTAISIQPAPPGNNSHKLLLVSNKRICTWVRYTLIALTSDQSMSNSNSGNQLSKMAVPPPASLLQESLDDLMGKF